MASECETTACCETTGQSCGGESASSQAKRCGCGSDRCSGDPTECALGMWSGAFFQALNQVQVELLKAKIQKAWGSQMDKAAEAVLEAMGAQWQSMMAQSKAKADLRQRLQALWQAGQK